MLRFMWSRTDVYDTINGAPNCNFQKEIILVLELPQLSKTIHLSWRNENDNKIKAG
jgi:hypothetical protein